MIALTDARICLGGCVFRFIVQFHLLGVDTHVDIHILYHAFTFNHPPRRFGDYVIITDDVGYPEIGGCEVAKQSACSTRAWNEWNCKECMLTGVSTAR